MTSNVRVLAILSLLSAIIFIGCGSGDDSSSGGTDSSVRDADGKSPFDVLKAGVMAGNEGNYDEAATWVVPSGGMVGDNFMLWQRATNNGSVSKIEFTDETYRGQDVSVGYVLHFGDGSTKKDEATLRKVDDRWKIEWLSSGF